METIAQNLIGKNPYRILGVYVGCTIAKEFSNRSRISAYSKIGQTATFDLKGDDTLPSLMRDERMAEEAMQQLSLSVERVRFSLFWYADEKHRWAPIINRAIDSMLSGDLEDALCCYENLIQDNCLRDDFVKSVAHGIFSIEKEEIANIIADTISKHLINCNCILKSSSPQKAYLLNTILFKKRLKEEFYQTKRQGIKNVNNYYELYNDLKSITKQLAPYINFAAMLFGRSDYNYKILAEDTANLIYKYGVNILISMGRYINTEAQTHFSIGVCRSEMDELAEFVDNSIKNMGLDNDSRRIIGEAALEFEAVYSKQTDKAKERYEKKKQGYWFKEIIKTAIWLGIIIFIMSKVR
ncbi:MAG: hypothetical protein IKT53_06030 [Bacteroidaceae bacterium]|nr:hypothetical protein [Bacteroidaceae bacterium]